MLRAFINANVIDVLEKKTIPNCTVLVENGIIKAVGPEVDTTGAEIVDIAGKYLTPGLFNLHVHTAVPVLPQDLQHIARGDNIMECEEHAAFCAILGMKHMAEYIRSGVTFVRDVGSPFSSIWELRRMAKLGQIKMAPEMQLCGRPIVQTGGTTWNMIGYEVDGVDECLKATRLMIRSGADWLKVMGTGGVVTRFSKPSIAQFTMDELKTIVDEGHKFGIKSCIHVQNEEGARQAILAGFDCLEHGFVLTDELIEMMLERGTWLDPTLSAPYCIYNNSTDPEFKEKARLALENSWDSFKRAYKAGVPCVLANDCGTATCFHYNTAMEMVLMVEKCGLSAYDAFEIGTINSARCCDVDDKLGSVTVGKKAHFAVFEKDPIADINASMDNFMTIKDGEVLWRKDHVSYF